MFVESYLQCWNATEAARRANYKHPNKKGPWLVKIGEIEAEINARLEEEAMSANEVLQRLGQQARFDPTQYMNTFGIDLDKLQADGLGYLLKGTRPTPAGTVYLFHDGQNALIHLGKHHKLFTEKHEVTGKDGAPLFQDVSGVDFDKL